MSNVHIQPAEKVQIQLVRPNPSVSWGFRLQGGIDFQTPLSIQSVNANSVSELCGLKAGDAILSINQFTSDALSHGEAKEEIMRSGNQISMLVERGAVKIWKPQVTPMSELRPQELRTIKSATGEEIAPVQKTSLAINKPPDEPCTIGSSHNRSAQPFGMPMKSAVPNVVHAQYNSPMGLYSADNIADSYSQQTAGIQQQMAGMDITDQSANGGLQEDSTPVNRPGGPDSSLSPGGHLAPSTASSSSSHASPRVSSPPQTPSSKLGHSARYEEQVGDTPEYRGYTNHSLQSRTFKRLQEEMEGEEGDFQPSSSLSSHTGPQGFRSISAPVAKPPSEKPQSASMRCGDCDMLATGVIVKANGVPYHMACFKCASCSMNLKQKGYFVVDNQLYCETHAKRKAQPPAPNMVATAVYR